MRNCFSKKLQCKGKNVDRQGCPTLEKERKIVRNIKPKYGLFKLGPWAPQAFKGEELCIKWA